MTKNKLYIGNLSYQIDTAELNDTFAPFGEITDVVVIKDRESGRSRGFGFVSYATGEQATAAITALNGQELKERPLRIKYAEPRKTEQFA